MNKCVARIPSHDGWGRGSVCGCNAKIERDGHWFCGKHDPAKREARAERWKAESAARMVLYSAEAKLEEAEGAALAAFLDEHPQDVRVQAVHEARYLVASAKKALEEIK